MTQIELREILSSNIKFYRKRLFLTQEKLAEKTGLSAQTGSQGRGDVRYLKQKSEKASYRGNALLHSAQRRDLARI